MTLAPIEDHVRHGEEIDPGVALVLRGWPLTVDGMLRNADATRRRWSRAGTPFVAVSGEITVGDWTAEAILSGPRMRTRLRYAEMTVEALVGGGFELLPTFAAPHCSVILPAYTEEAARRLLDAFGPVRINPHHVRRDQ